MDGADAVRAVVVTGASSGIGEAAALELDRCGFKVFAGVRGPAAAERLAAAASTRLAPLELDVAREESVRAAADAVAGELGEEGVLAGVVNSAGIVVSGPLEHVSLADFRRQLDVNVVGPLAVVQAFLPLLRRSGGRIVNVGSTSGRIAGPMIGPYCASKFALEALTKVMAAELHAQGIRVSLIEPGVVATPLWKKARAAEEALAARLRCEDRDRYAAALGVRRRRLRELEDAGEPPGRVAAAIVEALTSRRPKPRYVVGFRTRLRVAVTLSLPDAWLHRLRARGSG
ncbi:MAG TPA: SDR family NAD(P)-dependent oxidoreductase [Gammaproteobacteria bacterium]